MQLSMPTSVKEITSMDCMKVVIGEKSLRRIFLSMVGFELRILDVGGDRSTSCATTTAI